MKIALGLCGLSGLIVLVILGITQFSDLGDVPAVNKKSKNQQVISSPARAETEHQLSYPPGYQQSREPARTEPAYATSQLKLFGKVTDEHGLAVSGVVVGFGNFDNIAYSDPDGTYQLLLELEQRDNFVIRFLKSGYREQSYTLLVSDNLPGSLELPMILAASDETVTVAGVLLDEDGNVVPAQPLRLRSGALGRHYRTYSNTDGYYAFEGVKAGNYDLTVFSQGPYKRYHERDLTIAAPIVDYEIRLGRVGLGVFTGTITDGDGVALHGLTIRAHSSATPNRPHTIKTDAAGRFEIHNAAAGLWTVSTRHNGYFRLSNINLPPHTWLNEDLVLDIGPYELSGSVYDSFYNSIPDASVEITLSDRLHGIKRTSRRATRTNVSGAFHAVGLAVGNYRLNVSANGYQTQVLYYPVGYRSDPAQIVLHRQALN